MEMIYVLCTFHPVDSFPETDDTIDKLVLCVWFNSFSQVVLEFIPEHLNWIEIWTFGWCFPMVDAVVG